ncbi:Ig-like protein group 2 [Anoxybacillus vitaminiphilus]|uniref:Ig-like protein group 2 n=1 Tax=Paranoxybacillus vitaminiphilus TaxID=581036 RepID=A0A327YLJ5_9BACL|nr:VWA domain-containing protein [Anoxybacillus vitaminiphilus]RAK21371.1 Ig-like protein group 2 [Anoxybacillus vitaminiphilus]
MQIRLSKLFSLFLIFVIVLSSLLFNGDTIVQAQENKTGGIEEVNEHVIRGWATSPGEGNGGGNTIEFFIVKVKIKGNSASEESYRVEATEAPSDKGEKKYTFSLDMTGKWPKSSNPNVTYEIEVDAYRIVGNRKEEKYFTFPTPAYEYQKGTSNVNNPSLDFTVSASQSEYAKPLNEDAQGRLDVTLTPQGRIDSIVRPPIDVVFVFDISGSMDELGSNPMKFQSAKQALNSAVDYFKANANPNDRFALVPFSSNVQYNNVVPFPSGTYDVKQHLDRIAATAKALRANGGTNYTQALQNAQSFFNDPTRKKYIIFLTDGMPTVSKAKERVTYEVCEGIWWWKQCHEVTEDLDVEYVLYADGRTADRTVYYPDGKQTTTYRSSTTYKNFQEKIRTHGINVAKDIGINNIALYSIGFGNNEEVDMNYLEKLSSMTGGQAKQGTPQNLTEIFQQFSKLATDPVLSGTVKIPLKAFNGKVQIVENENVWLDDAKENAYVTFNISYKVGQPAPPPVNIPIPVLFKEKGTYTFNIEMTYRDVYGALQPTKTKSVTVVVKDEVPPSFTGNVRLQGITRDVSDLIKYGSGNGDSNRFTAQYSLTAVGYVGSGVTGNLSNIKIIQPLPEGITVIPSSNVTVYSNNGITYAEIAFLNTNIDYTKLNSANLTASLTLQADWAMENMQLPQAKVSFTDSKYGTRTSTLPVAPQFIGMKVRLLEFPDIYYEGDIRGLVSKWQASSASTNLLATTKHPNDYGLLMLPIKSLEFKPNSKDLVIIVTYKNDQIVELNLTPRLKIFTNDGREIASGSVVTEATKVRVVGLVAGEGVSYEYRVENAKQDASWKPLSAPYEIPITFDGDSVIFVKSKGGFTKGDGIATVEITYHKLVNQIVLGPYKNEMNVNEVQTLQATVLPSDATNKNVRWSSSNPSVASVENGVVTALSPGNVTIYVEALDGSGVTATANITVVDPTVPLESIQFKQPSLNLNIGERIRVASLLQFNPFDATNKQLASVLSSDSQYVEIKKENGEWYIYAKDYGYATVTAVAEEKQPSGQEIKDSIVIIVTKSGNSSDGGNNGGNNGDMPRGRW